MLGAEGKSRSSAKSQMPDLIWSRKSHVLFIQSEWMFFCIHALQISQPQRCFTCFPITPDSFTYLLQFFQASEVTAAASVTETYFITQNKFTKPLLTF